MTRQSDLFERPKAKPKRIMARMIDAGQYPDGRKAAHFACKRCGWVQWIAVTTPLAGRRGYPRPTCNQPQPAG